MACGGVGKGWVLAALALVACSPDESKTGALGNGVFSYDCIGAQDPSCPDPLDLDQKPFPASIAFGGRFNLTYTPKDTTTYPNVSVQAVSTDFVISDGDTFGAMRAGTPWFVAFTQSGTVLDITPLPVEAIGGVQVNETTSAIISSSGVGSTHTYAATALGALGQPLAGEVLYTWTSSNAAVLAIQDPSGEAAPASTVSVVLAGSGTATLTASTPSGAGSTAQGSITVDVGGTP